MNILDNRKNKRFTIIAGPCTVDSKEQLEETAAALSELGVSYMRGGAFKMRTSCKSYQGLAEDGLVYLKEIGAKYQMKTVSEIIAREDIELMSAYVDILMVGARSMQNYPLLRAIGETSKPVILKRGMANTVREWLKAGEYITQGGNQNLIFCERGIRTFESSTRNTLDLSVVPIMKQFTPFPIIVDPSHSTGRADIVKEMCWAAAACGADGLIIECDANPESVKCDAHQTISIDELKKIINKLPQILSVWGKSL